jgi:ribosomal protein S18 acetylase RimI-like enzyme
MSAPSPAPESNQPGDPEFVVTSDPSAVDLDAVHDYLRASYWSADIPRDTLARAIANSIPFSVLHGARQVGFARVVTDRATFAYLSDVYILEAYRGRGLARRLMDAIMAHPDLQGLRRFSLTTRDADGLYRRYGFVDLANPDRHLEIYRPLMYRQDSPSRTDS